MKILDQITHLPTPKLIRQTLLASFSKFCRVAKLLFNWVIQVKLTEKNGVLNAIRMQRNGNGTRTLGLRMEMNENAQFGERLQHCLIILQTLDKSMHEIRVLLIGM